jgi:hypothetical protein
MSRLCVLICRVDDENQPDELTLLSRQELPVLDRPELAPATTVDQMESRAVTASQELVRQLIYHQWESFDQQLAADLQRLSPPVETQS